MHKTLHFSEGSAIFGVAVPLQRFPELLKAHMQKFPDTPKIECQGERLLIDKFPVTGVNSFVKVVCGWGGYSGIRGRVLKRNSENELKSALSAAAEQLSRNDVGRGLASVKQLNSFGISFASKHLRFMRPDLCPVFDSVLHEVLPYSYDTVGYSHFASDCTALADKLKEEHVPNPRNRDDGRWFAADVEAALFIHANNLKGTRQ